MARPLWDFAQELADLTGWSLLTTLTNTSRSMPFTDEAATASRRFYRAVSP